MLDSYGREIDYVRISLTDHCNLRCVYCMPDEHCSYMKKEMLLTDEQIIRICTVLANNGVKKIKLTGGEPLIRKSTPYLVKQIKQIPGIEQVTLTTNGVLLEDTIDELVAAGLNGVNVSLDHLDRMEYAKITRRDELPRVLRGIKKACQYESLNVKINCVPIADNKQQIIALAKLAKMDKVHVRFIEMMPIGQGKQMNFHSEEAICKYLKEEFGELTPYKETLGNGPSHYYEIPEFQGKIGFISAISHKFCDQCNRVRITADGFLKTCLQYDMGISLRPYLNESCDERLREIILETLWKKPKEHKFHEQKEGKEEHRAMSQIGG